MINLKSVINLKPCTTCGEPIVTLLGHVCYEMKRLEFMSTENKKPLELWIDGFKFGPDESIEQTVSVATIPNMYKLLEHERIHVVEASALNEARAENERLRKILHKEFNENDELGAEYLGITMVRDENRDLRAEIEKLKEYEAALKFYAKKAWMKSTSTIINEVGENDLSKPSENHKLMGGKRAREVLNKWKVKYD